MSSYSPRCASTLSLKGTELDPRPVTMGSVGTNHGGSSGVWQGCWRRQEAEQGPATARNRGKLSSAGMLATTTARQWWHRQWAA